MLGSQVTDRINLREAIFPGGGGMPTRRVWFACHLFHTHIMFTIPKSPPPSKILYENLYAVNKAKGHEASAKNIGPQSQLDKLCTSTCMWFHQDAGRN